MTDSTFQPISAELREAIESFVEYAVDQRLQEILGDPDEGIEVRQELIDRLRLQQKRVAAGERGRSIEDVANDFGLR